MSETDAHAELGVERNDVVGTPVIGLGKRGIVGFSCADQHHQVTRKPIDAGHLTELFGLHGRAVHQHRASRLLSERRGRTLQAVGDFEPEAGARCRPLQGAFVLRPGSEQGKHTA